MKIKNWGYGETWDVGNIQRRNVRWVAYCNKETFLRTIEEFCGKRGTRGWVIPRMCETYNDFELSLIKFHTGKMIIYDGRTHEILEVLKLIAKAEGRKP